MTVVADDREGFAGWARRRRNPLIFLGVTLVVAGTVGFRLWRSRFQDLPRIAERGRVQGLAALDAGNFDTAHLLLSEAKRAVEALGDDVEGASEIRHGAEEAAIFSNLVPESLESILTEASSDPKEWSGRFDTFYRGRAIIIDATVISTPGDSGSGRYDLDYRILPNDGEGTRPKRVGRIELGGFHLFEVTRPKAGDKVVFGARIASFSLDADSALWQVGLEPESGVSLTHPLAREALGWPSADETMTGERP